MHSVPSPSFKEKNWNLLMSGIRNSMKTVESGHLLPVILSPNIRDALSLNTGDADNEILRPLLNEREERTSFRSSGWMSKLKDFPKPTLAPLAGAVICGFAYVCMNRVASKLLVFEALRDLTAGDSAVINTGLYYIVFGKIREMPAKYQTFMAKYFKTKNKMALWSVGLSTFALCEFLCALPILESTLAGALLLNLPTAVATPLAWFMNTARAVAVFQGILDLPETWAYIKRKYQPEGEAPRRHVAVLGAVGFTGAAAYVFTMRNSVLSAIGNVSAMGKGIACGFQRAALGVHLAVEWASTAINYPFYATWITRGIIRTFEPFWDPNQRNQIPLRVLALVMSGFSLVPSAAPLFAATGEAHPDLVEGCQMTGSWVASHTRLGFESSPLYLTLAAVCVNMLFAWFMNNSSLFLNFGIYKEKQERHLGDPVLPVTHRPTATSGYALVGEPLGMSLKVLPSPTKSPNFPISTVPFSAQESHEPLTGAFYKFEEDVQNGFAQKQSLGFADPSVPKSPQHF